MHDEVNEDVKDAKRVDFAKSVDKRDDLDVEDDEDLDVKNRMTSKVTNVLTVSFDDAKDDVTNDSINKNDVVDDIDANALKFSSSADLSFFA